MRPPLILVGRARRWNVVGDLRSAGMRPAQCSGEGDAGAGDLCTGRVRKSERRGDGDCGVPPNLRDGRDNRRLRVCATVDGDGLAVAETSRVGDRDNRRAHSWWRCPP